MTLAPIKPGEKYGRLTVVNRVKTSESGRHVLCICDCGASLVVRFSYLLSGNTKSCGCFKIDRVKECKTTHGQSGSKLYYIWIEMRQRCGNKKNGRFRLYGKRGISVCDEWQDFSIFRDWALSNGYRVGLTLDRIDVNGNYEPSNCRWASQSVQCNNTRRNKMITYKNKTMSMSDWAKKLGVNYNTLRSRIRMGWSIEKAFETKFKGINK